MLGVVHCGLEKLRPRARPAPLDLAYLERLSPRVHGCRGSQQRSRAAGRDPAPVMREMHRGLSDARKCARIARAIRDDAKSITAERTKVRVGDTKHAGHCDRS